MIATEDKSTRGGGSGSAVEDVAREGMAGEG